MHMHSLNWLAILVAAISTMVVGFFVVLAPALRKGLGARNGLRSQRQSPDGRDEKSAVLAYTGSFLASIVSAFTTGAVPSRAPRGARRLRLDGWLPCVARFVATVQLTGVLFMNRA